MQCQAREVEVLLGITVETLGGFLVEGHSFPGCIVDDVLGIDRAWSSSKFVLPEGPQEFRNEWLKMDSSAVDLISSRISSGIVSCNQDLRDRIWKCNHRSNHNQPQIVGWDGSMDGRNSRVIDGHAHCISCVDHHS